MRVVFLSPSVSRAAGGIFEIEKALALSLARLPETRVEVFGLADEFSTIDAPSWHPLIPAVHPVSGPRALGYSPSLRRAFLACDADVAHLHCLWMYTSPLMRRWAAQHRRPFLTTLNGMLDPWALRNSAMKKAIATLLYERSCLGAATCIQVNSEAELRSARDFGLKGPICVIPNGVTPPHLDAAELAAIDHPLRKLKQAGTRVLLYLGRLHPKKGLANLVDAFASIAPNGNGWTLAIAGWDQLGHERALRAQAAKLGLGERVMFLGPQFGAAKAAAFHQADAVILPSYSEGLPMVVLEAWSHAKPVLMTPACNLPIGFDADAAISIEPKPDAIVEGIRRLFQMSDFERAAMGRNGRQLVGERFSWATVAGQMHAVYNWLLTGHTRPDCIALR